MKQSKLTAQRLNNILLNDKVMHPNKITEVLKSDAYFMLNDYMELKKEDLCVDLQLCDNGRYQIFIKATTDRIKEINS